MSKKKQIPTNNSFGNLLIAPITEEKCVELDERVVPEREIEESIITDGQQNNEKDFYLYWDLKNKATNKPRLDMHEIDELLRLIKQMDCEGFRLLYVLIKMYSMKTQADKIYELPYSARKMKESNEQCDMEFDLKNIPNTLQRMLLVFCRMHMDNIKVNKIRGAW